MEKPMKYFLRLFALFAFALFGMSSYALSAQDATKAAKTMQGESKKAIKRAGNIVKEIEKMPEVIV